MPGDGVDDGISLAVGSNCPGVLREYAVFEEQHLVRIPEHLSWEEVSLCLAKGR